MKKIIIILAIIISILVINKEEKIIIPQDSIRFRVIANSNKVEDQLIKKEIVKKLEKELVKTNTINNISEARSYIINEIPKFEEKINQTINENNSHLKFNIKYGNNYFPKKEYKGVIYNEGEYESLVVTLGEGKGKNFWCVLFPPLCMINNDDNTEYKSIIKEIINKYF